MDNILHAFCFYAAAALWAQWDQSQLEVVFEILWNMFVCSILAWKNIKGAPLIRNKERRELKMDNILHAFCFHAAATLRAQWG